MTNITTNILAIHTDEVLSKLHKEVITEANKRTPAQELQLTHELQALLLRAKD